MQETDSGQVTTTESADMDTSEHHPMQALTEAAFRVHDRRKPATQLAEAFRGSTRKVSETEPPAPAKPLHEMSIDELQAYERACRDA